ncbi:hypothetical protein BV378_14095 [Nostoc sp. RF31YmG]|jgi:hypothetical protein|nr:hypothetical protein BV378_14095 [Nostoc sp. RF31YmG]
MKTIEEIRLANLLALKAGFPSERQFAIKLNKQPNQVNQWFGKGAARAIQSESAREVEKLMGKPVGWLDNDHSQSERLDAEIIRAAITLAKQAFRLGAGDELIIERDPEAFVLALRAALATRERMEEQDGVRSGSRDEQVGTVGGTSRAPEDGEATGSPPHRRKRA